MGPEKINVFVLAVAYEGLAIPLFWTLLPKSGSSNYQEQKTLLTQFFKIFEKTAVAGLLSDEFASGKLMKWLNKKRIIIFALKRTARSRSDKKNLKVQNNYLILSILDPQIILP